MNQTMTKLQKFSEADYTTFIRAVFGLSSLSPLPADLDKALPDLKFIDHSLNDSQKDAIRFAMISKEMALIHGPPGVRHFSGCF
jgi:DNA polymerase alpha-associated DNA helicase A